MTARLGATCEGCGCSRWREAPRRRAERAWAPVHFPGDGAVSGFRAWARWPRPPRPRPAPVLLSGPALLMEKYRKCGFSQLWAASAFKGATGASQALTPTEHHLRNHMQWLQVAASGPADALQGIVLTGWQR